MHVTETLSLASRIKAMRRHKSLTQEGLARLTGATRPSIAQWETGKARPSYETISALSKALGVRAAWLAFGEPPGPDANSSPTFGGGMAATTIAIQEHYPFRDEGNLPLRHDWYLPANLLSERTKSDGFLVTEVTGSNLPSPLQRGDKVLVNTVDKAPAPDGNFAFWQRDRIAFAHAQYIGSDKEDKLRLSQGQHVEFTLTTEDAELIGRVEAIVYRRSS